MGHWGHALEETVQPQFFPRTGLSKVMNRNVSLLIAGCLPLVFVTEKEVDRLSKQPAYRVPGAFLEYNLGKRWPTALVWLLLN